MGGVGMGGVGVGGVGVGGVGVGGVGVGGVWVGLIRRKRSLIRNRRVVDRFEKRISLIV